MKSCSKLVLSVKNNNVLIPFWTLLYMIWYDCVINVYRYTTIFMLSYYSLYLWYASYKTVSKCVRISQTWWPISLTPSDLNYDLRVGQIKRNVFSSWGFRERDQIKKIKMSIFFKFFNGHQVITGLYFKTIHQHKMQNKTIVDDFSWKII